MTIFTTIDCQSLGSSMNIRTGVQNPIKMSDIINFPKPNATDLNIQKSQTRFPQFSFQKPTLYCIVLYKDFLIWPK